MTWDGRPTEKSNSGAIWTIAIIVFLFVGAYFLGKEIHGQRWLNRPKPAHVYR